MSLEGLEGLEGSRDPGWLLGHEWVRPGRSGRFVSTLWPAAGIVHAACVRQRAHKESVSSVQTLLLVSCERAVTWVSQCFRLARSGRVGVRGSMRVAAADSEFLAVALRSTPTLIIYIYCKARLLFRFSACPGDPHLASRITTSLRCSIPHAHNTTQSSRPPIPHANRLHRRGECACRWRWPYLKAPKQRRIPVKVSCRLRPPHAQLVPLSMAKCLQCASR
jgi:hypothetical protein